jgi:mannose-6-phosphate isomerase-like protein (cupin superfamily)
MLRRMSRYRLVDAPTRIPVPGGKLIEELFGRVNTGTDAFSLARMVAPAGWSEPAQRPEFGELTVMLRGALEVVVDDETLVLRVGQAFFVEPGVRVRYGNPFAEPCEYYAICTPAFDPRTVHREDESA